MKEFDLEAAKQGAAVCTRRGLPVRIICWDMKCKSYGGMDRIVYLTDYNRDEHLSSCWLNGSYLTRGATDDGDLMMRDDDFQERLARGEYSHDNEDNRATVKESLQVGLSRRDLLTGMAMQGWLSSLDEGEEPIIEKMAELCVRVADALIAELDKPSEK